MKRLLLLIHDPLVAEFFRELLSKEGFNVSTVADPQEARLWLQKHQADLIVTGVVFPEPSMLDELHELAASPAISGTPVHLLPFAPNEILASATWPPNVHVLSSEASVLDEIWRAAGGVRPGGDSTLETLWRQRLGGSTVGPLGEMRACVRALAQDYSQLPALHALFYHAHTLSQRLLLGENNTLANFSITVELLAYFLHALPDHINPSNIRTITQATDFLAATLESGAGSLRGAAQAAPRIMAVDDDPMILDAITASLSRTGMSVTTSGTPAEALEISARQSFDLILLDVGLPEMSGFELCTRLRKMPAHQSVPIVFLTGLATFANRVQSSLSGGNDFLGKPFHMLELPVKVLLWIYKTRLGQP